MRVQDPMAEILGSDGQLAHRDKDVFAVSPPAP